MSEPMTILDMVKGMKRGWSLVLLNGNNNGLVRMIRCGDTFWWATKDMGIERDGSAEEACAALEKLLKGR